MIGEARVKAKVAVIESPLDHNAPERKMAARTASFVKLRE
jgi:hypothetical protein